MPSYRIGRLGKRFVVNVYGDDGRRLHRYRLGSKTKSDAEQEAPGVAHELLRPRDDKVATIWAAYIVDHAGRAIVENMAFNWRALAPRFSSMPADSITPTDCRAYIAARRRQGKKDGTIATELGRLRMVLLWAEKQRVIARAPQIVRPTPPKRKEHHLTREQCRDLIAAATFPHVRLFIVLALATGGRDSALRELTWDRVDFDRGLIDLKNPDIARPHKGRAVVPMNRTARAALMEAREGALSNHVIEWAGKPVSSVKRGLKAAARLAGISGSVSPHLFRHSAAVHLAEAGISMEVIAQYLGHEDVATTREIYARFSPTYLRAAADVLQYDDLGSMNQKNTTGLDDNLLNYMVGATGIEPVTPTMSR